MNRYHMLQKSFVVLLMLVLIFVVVAQGGASNTAQSTVTKNNKTSESENSVVTSYDSVYSLTPDWVSDSPHYSTGGAFADFNNDDWLDFIVSDGNDMGQGHVRVYMNDGNGHLPTDGKLGVSGCRVQWSS